MFCESPTAIPSHPSSSACRAQRTATPGSIRRSVQNSTPRSCIAGTLLKPEPIPIASRPRGRLPLGRASLPGEGSSPSPGDLVRRLATLAVLDLETDRLVVGLAGLLPKPAPTLQPPAGQQPGGHSREDGASRLV